MNKTLEILSPELIQKKEHWQKCRQHWLAACGSDNTRRSYSFALDAFLRAEQIDPWQAERIHAYDWVETLKQKNLKKTTISARIHSVSSFYMFASDYFNLEEINPFTRKMVPKVKRYEVARVLTVAEIQQLLGQFDINDLLQLRDYALYGGYIVLGRRNHEWRTARANQFESINGEIFYRWSGKGKTDELVEVPEALWQLLQAYIAASGGRSGSDYIFLNEIGAGPISESLVSHNIKKYVKAAGIDGNVRVHDLRHTAAFLRRLDGADVEEVRDFLGHESLNTTQIYLHKIVKKANDRGKSICSLIHLGTDLGTDK